MYTGLPRISVTYSLPLQRGFPALRTLHLIISLPFCPGGAFYALLLGSYINTSVAWFRVLALVLGCGLLYDTS
jgi:hypothetical protein